MISILIAAIVTITILQVIVLGTVIFLDNRDPAKTIIWLLILGTLPLLGILLYLIFGRSFRLRKLSRYSKKIEEIAGNQEGKFVSERLELTGIDLHNRKLIRLLRDASAPLTINNRAEVLTNGEETFTALFQAMEAAKHHINLEYYIFKDDEVGQDVLNILARKASDGVRVRVLVDGWGSRSLSKQLKKLQQSGLDARCFAPVKFPFVSSKLNLRNHRKIVVVDGRVGFVGGLNIGDEYLSRSKKYGFWRDTFLKLEGESVHSLQTIFFNDWYFVTGENVSDAEYYPQPVNVGHQLTQIAGSGPNTDWDSMLQVFFTAMTNAQQRIYIETPYFIPDESTMMALRTAALSDVDVRLITQGIPDHRVTYWAARSYFEELLNAGVKIYCYRKGILHAKTLMIDGKIGSVGSTNFDIRSFQLNFEATAFIYDKDFAARLEQDFYTDLKDCEEITLAHFRQRPLGNRVKESAARLLSPLL